MAELLNGPSPTALTLAVVSQAFFLWTWRQNRCGVIPQQLRPIWRWHWLIGGTFGISAMAADIHATQQGHWIGLLTIPLIVANIANWVFAPQAFFWMLGKATGD
jgi:hypothetical protein